MVEVSPADAPLLGRMMTMIPKLMLDSGVTNGYRIMVNTGPDDFFPIIIPGHQGGTINIALISDTGWLGEYVVDPSTDGTRTASGEPTQ